MLQTSPCRICKSTIAWLDSDGRIAPVGKRVPVQLDSCQPSDTVFQAKVHKHHLKGKFCGSTSHFIKSQDIKAVLKTEDHSLKIARLQKQVADLSKEKEYLHTKIEALRNEKRELSEKLKESNRANSELIKNPHKY